MPLKIMDTDFHLYKIVAVPCRNNVLDMYVSIDTEYPFLANRKTDKDRSD